MIFHSHESTQLSRPIPSLDDLSPVKQALLAKMLAEHRNNSVSAQRGGAWLVRGPERPAAKRRVVLFPHAGGGSAVYRTWHARFSPEIESYAVCLPGRETRAREPHQRDLLRAARSVALAVAASVRPPYTFFGHSMGALLAFETARELRRTGRATPECLLVASYCAPCTQTGGTSARRHETEEQIIERLVRGHSLDARMARELFATLRPTLVADVAMCESYEYRSEAPLDCPVRAYRGALDYVSDDEMQGWARETRHPFELKTFSGDHFFTAHHAGALVQEITHHTLPRGTQACVQP